MTARRSCSGSTCGSTRTSGWRCSGATATARRRWRGCWRAQLPAHGQGTMAHPNKLKVGYFTQYQVEELESDATPLQHMSRLMKGATPGAVRAQLGRFGFSGAMAKQQVGKMSGGERARLALALITRDAPHLLILDEPTNHLDVDAREALVQALSDYRRRGGGRQPRPPHDRGVRRPAGGGRCGRRSRLRRHARRLYRLRARRGANSPGQGRGGKPTARPIAAPPPKRANATRRCRRM